MIFGWKLHDRFGLITCMLSNSDIKRLKRCLATCTASCCWYQRHCTIRAVDTPCLWWTIFDSWLRFPLALIETTSKKAISRTSLNIFKYVHNASYNTTYQNFDTSFICKMPSYPYPAFFVVFFRCFWSSGASKQTLLAPTDEAFMSLGRGVASSLLCLDRILSGKNHLKILGLGKIYDVFTSETLSFLFFCCWLLLVDFEV